MLLISFPSISLLEQVSLNREWIDFTDFIRREDSFELGTNLGIFSQTHGKLYIW